MRKMLNKKGFSLVELMIVVVIMGILIAVAIPLYGAITDNAKNKTCKNNVKVIQQNAANYYAMHSTTASVADLKAMFDNNKMPSCPWDGDDADEDDYTVTISATGNATVSCVNKTSGEYDKHW